MKPTLIIFSILSVLTTTTEAVNFFKYLLCGGRDKNYHPQRVLPVDFKLENDQETPSCTPESSDRISIDENEQVTNDHEEEDQQQQIQQQQIQQIQIQELETTLKTKKVNKKKNKQNKIAVQVSEPENFLKGEPTVVKPPKIVLGENASIIRGLLGPNGVYINLSNLSEQSARELLKIKRHMKTVLVPEARANFLTELPKLIDYKSELSLRKTKKLLDDIEGELENVKNLKDFLKIVLNFYKTLTANVIVKDCTKAILSSGVFDTDELPEVFQMTIDQIFQFACVNGFDALAIELVQTKTAEELKLYRGIVSAFNESNDKLGHELLVIVGNKYGKEPGSVYDRICDHLDLYGIEEEEES